MFAGSGALGLEAVSRGAASSILVEQDRETVEMLRKSLHMLGAEEVVVQEADVLQWIKSVNEPFDIIFLDPPFGKNMIEQTLSKSLEARVAISTWPCVTGSNVPGYMATIFIKSVYCCF